MKKSPSSPSQPQSKSSRGFILGTVAGIVFASAVVWALIPSKAETQVPATTTVAATPAEDHEGHDHPDFKRISVDEAKAAIDRGEVTVLDVREMDAYLAGHIPGALHIPLTRVEGEIPYLPKGKPIVTYCTCPAEETSGAAAAILEKGGMQSMALTGGLGAWQQKGFQLASGQQ